MAKIAFYVIFSQYTHLLCITWLMSYNYTSAMIPTMLLYMYVLLMDRVCYMLHIKYLSRPLSQVLHDYDVHCLKNIPFWVKNCIHKCVQSNNYSNIFACIAFI